MLYTMIPLPFLVCAFKWFCSAKFDNRLRYYSTTAKSDLENSDGVLLKNKKSDRIAVRFGHPALYKDLVTPMVDANAEHLMKEMLLPDLQMRSVDGTASPMVGYSDIYREVEEEKPTGDRRPTQPYEFVQEEDKDFENFKRRAEFSDQFGGDGELYGQPEDLITRSGTPSTFQTLTTDTPIKRKALNSGFHTARSSLTQFDDMHTVDLADQAAAERSYSRVDDFRLIDQGIYAATHDVPPSTGITCGRERARSVDVDIPSPDLDNRTILAAGSHSGFGRR